MSHYTLFFHCFKTLYMLKFQGFFIQHQNTQFSISFCTSFSKDPQMKSTTCKSMGIHQLRRNKQQRWVLQLLKLIILPPSTAWDRGLLNWGVTTGRPEAEAKRKMNPTDNSGDLWRVLSRLQPSAGGSDVWRHRQRRVPQQNHSVQPITRIPWNQKPFSAENLTTKGAMNSTGEGILPYK